MLGAGWVVLLEVAAVVAPEILNDCTPTLGALTPWLKTDVFVVFVKDVPLENPVCVWVAAVVLGWTGLKGAVIAPGSLEGVGLPLFCGLEQSQAARLFSNSAGL